MATSKKAAKPRVKKASNPERIRTLGGLIRHRAETRFEFLKGFYVSISGEPYKIVKEAGRLCKLGLFDEARRQADLVPEKSYIGLNKHIEQRIVREAITSFVDDCLDRHAQFGVLGGFPAE